MAPVNLCVWFILHTHVQLGAYGGFGQEVEGLKRDKGVMMMELVRLRQQQAVGVGRRVPTGPMLSTCVCWGRVERGGSMARTDSAFAPMASGASVGLHHAAWAHNDLQP